MSLSHDPPTRPPRHSAGLAALGFDPGARQRAGRPSTPRPAPGGLGSRRVEATTRRMEVLPRSSVDHVEARRRRLTTDAASRGVVPHRRNGSDSTPAESVPGVDGPDSTVRTRVMAPPVDAATTVTRYVPQVDRAADRRGRSLLDRPVTTSGRTSFARAVMAGDVDSPRSLPSEHVPLARSLLGDAPLPSISTGPQTAAALRQAGSAAATVGRTIYLDRSPGSDPRSRAVVAHELVHVAHGGDSPRFLDDTTDDAEERQAKTMEVAVTDTGAPAPGGRGENESGPTEGEEPPGPSAQLDMEDIVERLTDRVLFEVERRGGRYGGVF